MAQYTTPTGPAKKARLDKYKDRMAVAKVRSDAKKGKAARPAKAKAKSADEGVAGYITKKKAQMGKLAKRFGLIGGKK